VPLLVVSLLPQVWFFLCVVLPHRQYLRTLPNLLWGQLLNRTFGIFLSPLVFLLVLLSFGSFNWGKTGSTRRVRKHKHKQSALPTHSAPGTSRRRVGSCLRPDAASSRSDTGR